MTLTVFVIRQIKISAALVFILGEVCLRLGNLFFIAIRQKISARIVIYSFTKHSKRTENKPIIRVAF